MNQKQIPLGVLGGLGPMSTIYFCELLIARTRAERDADHIDMLISNRASTPDRTAFILGQSKDDPLPVMIEEANRLADAGASLLVIPCNTAHYFYDGLKNSCRLPILNIIEETVAFLHRDGVKTIGLLATDGTVQSGSYEKICNKYGMTCLAPDPDGQRIIMSIIYDEIKQNKPVDRAAFMRVANSWLDRGCERLVLGCTELSLLGKDVHLDPRIFIDSLEVLAWRTILTCEKEPVGFPDSFDITKERRT